MTQSPPIYADVEIRILAKQVQGYPVELTVNHEQEYAGGLLDPTAILPWTFSNSTIEDGERLFKWLMTAEAFKTAWDIIKGQYPQRRLRLRLAEDAGELYNLPWELLRDANNSPSLDLAAAEATPFSRYIAGAWQPGHPILQRPIKMLVVIANPDGLEAFGLNPIDIASETQNLEEALTTLKDLKITFHDPALSTLVAIEAELRSGGYHILHLVAHGRFMKNSGQAIIYLSDEQGKTAPVTGQAFAQMLAQQLANQDARRDDKLRLVFLATCESAGVEHASALRGFAPQLVQAGLPAVVAMQDKVLQSTTRQFSHSFYQNLLLHGTVDLAMNQARGTLLTANLPGSANPVLFMRQRNGSLFGQEGYIISQQAENFWPFLIRNIERGQCIPILGPRVNQELLSTSEHLAETLAEKYAYPLPDRQNLGRVLQFMAINDPEGLHDNYMQALVKGLYRHLQMPPPQTSRRQRRRATVGLTQSIRDLNWAEAVLKFQEDQLHHLLAEIEFPLYLTTNFDSFMVEAIKYHHQTLSENEAGPARTVRQLGPLWTPQVDQTHSISDPEPDFDQPVVFHLNGFDGDAEQAAYMVLSEDDYLAHLIRLDTEQERILPTNLLSALSDHSLIFLGYSLDDWDFKIILQGLLKRIAQNGNKQKRHVGVQLEVSSTRDMEKARQYLQPYLGQFNIDIYWGTPRQFVSELHKRWYD